MSPTTATCSSGWSITLGPSTGRAAGARHLGAAAGALPRQDEPDPELEAAYLQFGRYLMISGSRGSLPIALQGPWLDGNDPDWMGDYHTDINIQMNYWMADRAALSRSFDAFTDYCLSQLPVWTELTQRLFNDPRNRFRNSIGQDRRLDRGVLHQHLRRQRLVVAPGGQRLARATPCGSTTSTPRTGAISRRSTRCSRAPASSGRPG